MTTFMIDIGNNITAFAALEDALNHGIGATEWTFSTEKELAKLSAAWPIARFAEVWNSFAGAPLFAELKELKRFTDRKSAVTRIWNAAQRLTALLEETREEDVSPLVSLPARSRLCVGDLSLPIAPSGRNRRSTCLLLPCSGASSLRMQSRS